MKTIFKIIIFIASSLFFGFAYGQELKEPTLKITDFIKGLDDNDYLRATLIENGFTFGNKSKVTGSEDDWIEYWKLNYKQKGFNFDNPFPVITADIEIRPSLRDKVFTSISISKEFFLNYGEKFLADVIKSFPYKKIDSFSISNDEKPPTYFVIYSRDIDNVVISYSFQNDDYIFEFHREYK